MKRKGRLIFLCFLFIFYIGGCGRVKGQNEDSLEEIEIGLIETNGATKKSGIIFYDENLNKKENLKLKYATVGDGNCKPVVQKGNLYVIPQGYENSKREKKVLEIDLKRLQKKIYEIDQIDMYGLSVDDKNIYTCGNLNFSSYIMKCEKETGDVEQKEMKDIYVTQVFAYEGKLYAFGTKMYPNKTKENRKKISYIYVYNENFELVDQVNLSQYGDLQDKVIAFEDKIYFSNTYNSETELPNNTVCAYSVKDGLIETITLEKKYPLDLEVYGDILIISHFDVLQHSEGNGSLSFVNLKTKEQRNCELDHGVNYMARKGENLYLLSERNEIYKYRIVDTGVELVKKMKAKMLYPDNYITALFAVENEEEIGGI